MFTRTFSDHNICSFPLLSSSFYAADFPVYCCLQLILGSECRAYKTADCEITQSHAYHPAHAKESGQSEYYTRCKPVYLVTGWGLGKMSRQPAPRWKG